MLQHVYLQGFCYIYEVQNASKNTYKKSDFIPRSEHEKALRKIDLLEFELAQIKRMIFGAKSERFIASETLDSQQLNLFNQDNGNGKPQEPEQTEEITYSRKKPQKEKKSPIRADIPEHLPRVEEVIEPEFDNKADYKRMGEKVTEVLEYSPGRIYVRKIIRPQYVKKDTENIAVAELPTLPIPKGNAGASLLAHILVSKYMDHLPFDRQVKIFKRSDVIVSKSTINGWFLKSTDLLEKLYVELEKLTLQGCSYLQVDESPIKVQDPNKKGTLHKGYMWVYHSPEQRLVLFRYNKSRGKEVPKIALNNFTGTIQTDGYAAYDNLKTEGEITHIGCLVHCRRKFSDALKTDEKRAGYVLKLIQQLYTIERQARERGINHATRKRYRQLYARPILNELEQWLRDNINQVLPQSAIGKAINYTYGQWKKVIRYIDDGKYEADNNLIENSIRPLAIGRKNFLFAGSHTAAQKAAIMYSLFASCKVNNVDPFEWLTDVLGRITDTKPSQMHSLLPGNWKK